MLSMLVQVTLFACLICVGFGAYLPPTKCPESCHCTQDDLNGSLRLKCTSLVFLAKLQPKQILAIEALDLSGQALRHIDAKLNRLRNLKELNLANNSLTPTTVGSFPKLPKLFSLDLSGNRLKRINAASLPGTLEILNLSHTELAKIPEDILELSDLRQLNLQGNPLRCDCTTTSVRDKLLKASVLLTKPVMCRDVAGKKAPQSLFTVSCAEEQDWDQMAGDDPFANNEGSGDDQAQNLQAIDNDGIADSKLSIDEEEFLPPSLPDKSETDNEEQVGGDEGSGDGEYATTTEDPSDDYEYDGSGLGLGFDETNTETEVPYIPPPEHENACIFDCSTETPPTTTVDPFDEPAPGIIDGFRILLTDITGQKEKEPEPEPEPVSEPTLVPKIHKELAEVPQPTDTDDSDKDDHDNSLVEVFDRESTKESDELMRQQTETQEGSMKTYFIIGALLVIMICLVIYSVIKKKRSRYPHQPNDDESTYKIPPSELQDMSHKKQAIDLPEKVPLMNGQNGTSAPKENGNGVEDKSTAAYPSTDRGMDKLHPTPTSHPHISEDVQLRDKDDGSRLIPETHRVTVQAKELSTPKTPLLVNRHRSDDGTIVTTPTTEQSP